MTNSRSKGAAGEREAAQMLRPWFPACQRGLQQHRRGWELPDLINTGQFFVEVKRWKKFTDKQLIDCWEKNVSDWKLYEKESGEKGLVPVMMYRPDRGKWRVMMFSGDDIVSVPWSEFAKLLG